ncbi:hypothetical protein CO540_00560 [Micromonospora sp. WMMA2032]|uniref:DUF4097 family beta strand repeat-containing protein n=1 Tax=unclassified Micromonospora TaxID=2617518 RepID=UPI000C058BC8|nr:DUF4097 family beta strand repeat-containing protein [Micromonospora sp. WMMA2032]ATO12518.1 hypothetical protein CO540_00560 [Micromonospora sp. WMMA2032]
MRTFDTPTPITAVLTVPAGRVQLVAADRPDTTVDIRAADPANDRDVRAAERTTADYANGILRIDSSSVANRLLGPTGAVEVTVQLPAGSRVDATCSGAEFRGVGRLGDIAVTGAYRQIKIDEAAGLRLDALDGDVEIGRLDGPGEVSTGRGDIRVAEARRGTLVLRTGSGDITVGAADGVSAALDADTGHGRIGNALRNDGRTELDIRATTGRGDINARSN